jgi:hypothetical protein
VFTDLSCVSDQTVQTRDYYVLLQKPLPEVGLYLTSVRYDSSVISPSRAVGTFLPTAFLLLLLRASRRASATGAHAALYARARDMSLDLYYKGETRPPRRPGGATAALGRMNKPR